MKHLQLLIDAITEYPFQDDVLLFMAVCFLVLLILAYGMGDRANHHYAAERNEAFLRKMRASFGADSVELALVQEVDANAIESSREVQPDQSSGGEKNSIDGSTEEPSERAPLKRILVPQSFDTESLHAPTPAPLVASAAHQPSPGVPA